MTISDPRSRDEILAAFDELREHGLSFWSEFEPGRFAASIGDAWSPADNVRHLIKSTLPVTKALKLPSLALRTLFGTNKKGSMTYTELVTKYRAALAAGGNAGKFAPRTEPVPENVEAWQRKLITVCSDSLSDLSQTVASWSDADLDRYRLPHPLLGKLTLREMLLFTLYHFTHHRDNVVKRLGNL